MMLVLLLVRRLLWREPIICLKMWIQNLKREQVNLL